MPTDAQNAYMADTFGVDPAAYPAGNASSGDAPASSDDTASQTTQPADDAAPPAQTADATAPAQPTAAAPDDAAADTSAIPPAGAAASTGDATQDADAAAEKPMLSVKTNGDGTFTLSGSGFVGNTAYIRAVGTGAKDYAYGQAWGSVPVSGGSFSATTPDVCGTEGGDRFFSANDGRPDPSDKTGTLWSNTVKVSCPNAGGGGGDDPGDDPGADPADPGAGDKGDGAGGGDQGGAAGASDAPAGAASAPDGATASDTSAVMPAGATASTGDAAQESDAATEKPTLSVRSNGDGTFTLSGSGFVGNTAYIRAVGTGARDYAYGQAWGSVPVSGGSFSATTPDVCGTEGGDRFFSANDGRPDASDKTGTLWSNTVKVSCPNAGGGGGDDPGDDPGGDPGGSDPGGGDPGSGDPGGGDPGSAADPAGAAGSPQAGTSPDDTSAAQDAPAAGAIPAGMTLPTGDVGPAANPNLSAASLLDPNSPANRQAIANVVEQSDEAEQWIRDYLHTNDLRPDILGDGSGDTVMFGNRTTKLATAISTTVAAGRMANLAHGGQALITTERVQTIVTDLLLAATPHAGGGSGAAASAGPQRLSMYLQYTFTPTTVHTPNAGGPETADQPAHTLTGQITAEFHADNGSGLEVSALGQATWFADDHGGRIVNQSGFTGVQVAWVWSFLDGALQAGPQFQALVGASRAQQGHSDRLQWTPTGQVGAGGQVQYAVPGLGGHVLVGFQAGVSGTAADGAPSTTDRTAGFTLTYKF